MKRVAPFLLLAMPLAACVSTKDGGAANGAAAGPSRNIVATEFVDHDPKDVADRLANVAQRCWIGKNPAFSGLALAGVVPGNDPAARFVDFRGTDPAQPKHLRIYVARKSSPVGTGVMVGVEQSGAEAAKAPVGQAATEILKGQQASCA